MQSSQSDILSAGFYLVVGIMQSDYHSKTLGKRSADLITALHERRRTTFSVEDVRELTGLNGKRAADGAQDAGHTARDKSLVVSGATPAAAFSDRANAPASR